MKICLITDTWDNVNGVCTTLKNVVEQLRLMNHTVLVIEPSLFKTVPAIRYPEVRISWNLWKVGKLIEQFDPDAIHIATEGPLGLAARWYCKVEKRGIPHNTSYHTKFPEYLNEFFRIPIPFGYTVMRWFHKFSTKVLVTTESMKKELLSYNFERLEVWSRGVDTTIFNPTHRTDNRATRPVLLCVSRASKEKGLDDFCSIKTTGTKIMVGDGPYLNELKSKYPDVIFTGYKHGVELAKYYADADVFVFPSRTDTFGVVLLEAMACGTPIAAYPVTGLIDVVKQGITGYLDHNLNTAITNSLKCDRNVVAIEGAKYTWRTCAEKFVSNLRQIQRKI